MSYLNLLERIQENLSVDYRDNCGEVFGSSEFSDSVRFFALDLSPILLSSIVSLFVPKMFSMTGLINIYNTSKKLVHYFTRVVY